MLLPKCKKIQISYIINLITGKLQIRLKFHVELNLIFLQNFFLLLLFLLLSSLWWWRRYTTKNHLQDWKKEFFSDESDQEAQIYLWVNGVYKYSAYLTQYTSIQFNPPVYHGGGSIRNVTNWFNFNIARIYLARLIFILI